MVRRDWTGFSAGQAEREQTWEWEGLPILRSGVTLPKPEGEAWRRIRRFYEAQSRAFWGYCKEELLPWARAEGRAALEAGREPVCASASLTFETTYRGERLWSLRTVCRETASPGGAYVRQWGDTWDLSEAYPVPLPCLFPRGTRWKQALLHAAETEIQRQERLGISRFVPDWRRRLRRYFRAENYYLTGQGVACFYPMYALAPAAEGIPAFLLPYDGEPPLAPLW